MVLKKYLLYLIKEIYTSFQGHYFTLKHIYNNPYDYLHTDTVVTDASSNQTRKLCSD